MSRLRNLLGATLLASLLVLAACTMGGGSVVPPEYRTPIRQAAKACPGVGPRLLAAQLSIESGWDPGAVSPAGAQGLAQFMPQTWQHWGVDGDGDGRVDPFDPDDAIASQGALMCHLFERSRDAELSGRPIALALAAYNAGWGAVEQHGGIPPYPETQAYVRDVLADAQGYRLTDPTAQ